MAAGCSIVTVVVAVHEPVLFPLAAVAVKVYVPADNPVLPTTVLLALVITTDEPTLLLTAIEPVVAPLQFAFVATPLTVIAMGCVMVIVVVAVHEPTLFPSGDIAVKVYVPTGKPVLLTTTLLAFLITTVEPVLLLTIIEPSDNPLQLTFVAVPFTVTGMGWVIVTEAVTIHKPPLFPSGAVAVKVYIPAGKPELLTTELPAFLITTVEPTPLLTAIKPSDKPLQLTFVAIPLTVTAIGCVIVTVAVAVHEPTLFPSAAVAVKVYMPAGKSKLLTTTLLALVITTVEPSLLVTAIEPSDKPLQLTFVAIPLTVTVIG